MTVAELIELLLKQDQAATVVIERDDDYWHVAEVDTAWLINPTGANPTWDYRFEGEPSRYHFPNAVRIVI